MRRFDYSNAVLRLAAALLTGIPVIPAAATAADQQAAIPAARLVIETGPLHRNTHVPPADAPVGANWWYYGVTLRETTGRSSLTLTGWRKCYTTPDHTGCEPVRANFDALFGSNRVPAGGALTLLKPAWVWARPTGSTFEVEATYWARDDAGKRLEARYRFSVTSD